MDKDKSKELTPEEQIRDIQELMPKEEILTEEQSQEKYSKERQDKFFEEDEQESDILEVNWD